MKLAFFNMEKWEKDILTQKFKKHKLVFSRSKLTKSNAKKVKDADVLAIFVDATVDKSLLNLFSKLKFISTMSTGFDHIDLDECKKRGIQVSNVPTYGENTVAQHAMALLLAISRRIVGSVERTRKGVYNYEGLRGFDLKGKTMGVVGTGNIGKHTCQMAKGFEMDVIAFDPKQDKKWAKKCGVTYVSMNKLLKTSEVISLHVPLNPHTKHLLNKKNMKLLKKGCIVINTARGGLVDTESLVNALESGRVGWAGLDTLEGEPDLKEPISVLKKDYKHFEDMKMLVEDHYLFHHPRVLVTPHNAFNSQDALMRILSTTIGNIQGFLKKKKVNSVIK